MTYRNTLLRRAILETLEQRQLMAAGGAVAAITAGSGQISGYVVDDANKDGKWNNGEKGIAGRQVWIDVNNNGAIDAGEPAQTTASNGKYIFAGLGAGLYNVRQVLPAGWQQTNPAPGAAFVVNLGNGQVLGGKDFGAAVGTGATPPPSEPPPSNPPSGNPPPAGTGTATVTGYVIDDVNKDGAWNNGEKGIAGRTVYVDANNNGQLDAGEWTAITASNGKFTFAQLPAGAYVLRQVLPTGWSQTKPTAGAAFTFNLSNGQTLGGRDFTVVYTGATSPTEPTPTEPPPTNPPPTGTGTATVSGYVVNDTNKDGKWNNGEIGIAGRTVYIDANNNGQLDAGEVTAVTASNGKYVFSQLPAGQYILRQVLPAGWSQTNPANTIAFVVNLSNGQSLGGRDFAAASTGGTTPTNPPTEPPPASGIPSVGGWATKTPLPQARSEMFGEAVGGKLYTFGGFYDMTFRPSRSAQVFDPATNTWTTIASLPVGLTHVAHAADDRYIYFAGGFPENPNAGGANQLFGTAAAWRYDTVTNTYAALPNLPGARGGGGMALVGRTLYYFGGSDLNRVERTESWKLNLDNPGAGWQNVAAMPTLRTHTAAVSIGGMIYLIAGQTGDDESAVMRKDMYRYDPSSNTWTQMASLGLQRSHVTSSVFVYNGRIVILGGESAHNTPIANIDSYDPATNTWTRIGTLPDGGRFSGVAGLVGNNTLVFAGGYTNYFRNTVWTANIA